MKKILLTLLAAAPLCLMAQTAKIAHVDVKAIYNAIPEKTQAQNELRAFSQQYQTEYNTVQDEFNKKFADYQALAADAATPATIKERRMQEIQESDHKIQKFLNKADADIAAKEKELNAPILERINQAIKAVGAEGGFTYILDISATPVPYMGPDAIDVTPLVKAKLGL